MEKPRILEDINSLTYFNFMSICHDIVSLELVGMNLIVLKEKHNMEKAQVTLRPVFGKERYPETKFGAKENNITGVVWIDKNFEVPIENHKSSHFQINSDIAKNFYQKYYYKNRPEDKDPDSPCLIHI